MTRDTRHSNAQKPMVPTVEGFPPEVIKLTEDDFLAEKIPRIHPADEQGDKKIVPFEFDDSDEWLNYDFDQT